MELWALLPCLVEADCDRLFAAFDGSSRATLQRAFFSAVLCRFHVLRRRFSILRDLILLDLRDKVLAQIAQRAYRLVFWRDENRGPRHASPLAVSVFMRAADSSWPLLSPLARTSYISVAGPTGIECQCGANHDGSNRGSSKEPGGPPRESHPADGDEGVHSDADEIRFARGPAFC